VSKSSPKIQLGIVGFGRIVELVHLPLLKHVTEIEVCGVFDVTPQRLDLAARRGFQTFRSLEELWASPAQAVLIATPPNTHEPIAVEALRNGKHLIIEKPVAMTGEAAVHLDQLAASMGLAVTVFHNRRYDRDFLLAKHAIGEGWLGRILFAERRHHMFGSGTSFGVKSFRPEWRNETRFGGGALLDWGPHLADQLLQLQLGAVANVSARMETLPWLQGDVEDYVQSTCKLESGALLSLEINFGSSASVPGWVIGGDGATLQIGPDNEATLLRKGSPPQSIAPDQFPKGSAKTIYESFAGHLLHGDPLAVSMSEAIETMKLLDAIRLSAKERREVPYGNSVLGAAARV